MKSMRKLLPVVIATLLISCSKKNEHPNQINSTDKNFIVQTYFATKAEIEAGRLTTSRANDPVVKDFGHRIVTDYEILQADLLAVAEKINFILEDSFFVQAQSITNLSDLSGRSFDTAYINSRVKSHFSLLESFRDEMNNGNNTYLRYYFLHKHMDKIKDYYLEADSIGRLMR